MRFMKGQKNTGKVKQSNLFIDLCQCLEFLCKDIWGTSFAVIKHTQYRKQPVQLLLPVGKFVRVTGHMDPYL